MPIKINLLAEAQAAEELRRRDPVKRAMAIGALLVVGMLLWAAWVYWNVANARREEAALQVTWKNIEKSFQQVSDEQKMLNALKARVASLDRYETNRFLWGSTLNGFQQTIPQSLLGKIQLTRLNGQHSYQHTEAIPAKKKAGKTEPAKPATSTERIVITVDAKDWSPAEQNYNKYKSAISAVPFFKDTLPESLIVFRTVNPVIHDAVAQKDFVSFTLELQIPPRTRDE